MSQGFIQFKSDSRTLFIHENTLSTDQQIHTQQKGE